MTKRIVKFYECLSYVVLIVLAALFFVSCTEESILVSDDNETIPENVNVGKLHNELITSFIKECPDVQKLNRSEYIQLFIETSNKVYRDYGVDIEFTLNTLNEFLYECNQWKKDGICDIFNPTGISPNEAIDNMVAAGIMPEVEALGLKSIFANIKKAGTKNPDVVIDQSLRTFLASGIEISEKVKVADNVAIYSCRLWREVYGDELIDIDPSDSEVDAWWKTIIKWGATGAGDGLAAWAGTYASANPYVGAGIGAFASLAIHEAFEERDW